VKAEFGRKVRRWYWTGWAAGDHCASDSPKPERHVWVLLCGRGRGWQGARQSIRVQASTAPGFQASTRSIPMTDALGLL